MSFKNPDRLKKKKNIVKKVTFAPKISNEMIKVKKAKEKPKYKQSLTESDPH